MKWLRSATFSGKYNFTDSVRKALAGARQEAIRLQHDYVGTEHILLGLIQEADGITAAVFSNLSVRPEQVRERAEELVRPGSASVVAGELPYTSRAKKVLEFAMAAARDLSHDYVGTEHLLLGLLRQRDGIAAEVLNRLGMTLELTRQEVQRLLHAPPPANAAFPIRIDDNSSASIYEQITREIQEAVATDRLRAGDRLPTVRQLADQLDIAPGTVARAYSELERLGVVVTEGARGTRVAEQKPAPLPKQEREDTLAGLLRPVAVAAFHLGSTASDLRAALERAMEGIFDNQQPSSG